MKLMIASVLLWHDDMDDPESDLKALREKLEEETGLYPHLEHCQEYMAAELPCLVEKYGDEERMKKAQSRSPSPDAWGRSTAD